MRASSYDMMAYDAPGAPAPADAHDRISLDRRDHLQQAGARHVGANGYPASKVVVIPNGFDTDRFRPAPPPGSAFAPSGASGRISLSSAWSRACTMKDHASSPRQPYCCWSRFLRHGSSVPATGSSHTGRRVLEVLGRSGLGERLKWLSYVRDMPAFYNALDVSTSSSAFGEGVSNAVAESMASGVPCVVTGTLATRGCSSANGASSFHREIRGRSPTDGAKCYADAHPSFRRPADGTSFRGTASKC